MENREQRTENGEYKTELSYGPVGAIIVSVFAFFAGQILGILLLVLVYMLVDGSGMDAVFDKLSGQSSASWGQFLGVLFVESITLAIIYHYLRHRQMSLRTIGFKNFQWFDIVRALVGFGVYFLLYFMATIVVKALAPGLDLDQEQQLGFDTSLAGSALIPVFISLVILPPLVEEILCRGFLYTGLRTKLKPVAAALITSVLFAAAHLQWGSDAPLLWIAALDTLILSLVLCYLRETTGRLWAPIFLHALKNLIAFSVLFLLKVG